MLNQYLMDTFRYLANTYMIKGAFSEMREFLATQSPFKMMKNAYSTSKALLVLKIFKLLS